MVEILRIYYEEGQYGKHIEGSRSRRKQLIKKTLSSYKLEEVVENYVRSGSEGRWNINDVVNVKNL